MLEDAAWLGVDLGTQGARALAVDGSGTVLAVATRPLAGTRDGERHEQDPGTWWPAVADALSEVSSHLDPAAVAGVATCSTSGTVLLVDPDGMPVTPALMYDDARAAPEADRVRQAGAQLWQRLGYRVGETWALPKLVWLLGHHEHHRGHHRGVRVAHQADVVNRALVGHPVATDTSHALKTGYDLIELRWPTDVLDALRIDPAIMPEVVLPGTPLGVVGPAAARSTGLRPGTPVLAGMTDGCAAQLGSGAVTPGEWNSVLGTTLVLKGTSERLLADPTGAVYSHRAPHRGWWLPGGASNTGAAMITELFDGADLDALTRSAAARLPAPVAYPLPGRGERFPFAVADAEGFMLGPDGAAAPLPSVGRDATAFAAICQGVAFVERLCFDHLHAVGARVDGAVAITGGATRNRWWNQLRADVLATPLRLPTNAEPALGMAVLAAARDGDVVAAAERMVHVGEVLEPRRGPGERLLEAYRRFVDALAARGWIIEELAGHAHGRSRA